MAYCFFLPQDIVYVWDSLTITLHNNKNTLQVPVRGFHSSLRYNERSNSISPTFLSW